MIKNLINEMNLINMSHEMIGNQVVLFDFALMQKVGKCRIESDTVLRFKNQEQLGIYSFFYSNYCLLVKRQANEMPSFFLAQELNETDSARFIGTHGHEFLKDNEFGVFPVVNSDGVLPELMADEYIRAEDGVICEATSYKHQVCTKMTCFNLESADLDGKGFRVIKQENSKRFKVLICKPININELSIHEGF